MPRSPEAFGRMREESRERILDSALTLFAERGFARSSIRMLADRAGVSQGLLYNYFAGKHELLREIMARGSEEVDRTFREAEAAAPSESLAVLIGAALAAVRSNPTFWRLSYQIRMQAEVLADVGPELVERASSIRSRIEELLEASGVGDAAARASLVFGAIDGVAQHYVLDPEGYPLDEVASEMVRRLVPGQDRGNGDDG